MPIPTVRLILLALVATVLLGWPGLDSGTGVVPVLLGLAVLACLAALDWFQSRDLLQAVQVQVDPITRMTESRRQDLKLSVQAPEGTRLSLAPGLPETLSVKETPERLVIPPETEWTQVDWPCEPARRGHVLLQVVHVETESRFRLWQLRRPVPVAAELRVYPHLGHERKKLAALLLQNQPGSNVKPMRGKGREFDMLREYVPGDSIEDIHWKMTAKRRAPVTKTFQIENTQDILVCIDASRLSARPLDESKSRADADTLLDQAIRSALILQQVTRSQGDRFGLVSFADRTLRFLRPGASKGHAVACTETLYQLRPQPVTPDFEDLFTTIRLKLRKRGLVIILSSLEDPIVAETFFKQIHLVSRKHVILVMAPALPGVAPVFAPGTIAQSVEIVDRLAGHLLWEQQQRLIRQCRANQVDVTHVPGAEWSTEMVNRYLKTKREQRLG